MVQSVEQWFSKYKDGLLHFMVQSVEQWFSKYKDGLLHFMVQSVEQWFSKYKDDFLHFLVQSDQRLIQWLCRYSQTRDLYSASVDTVRPVTYTVLLWIQSDQ